ncbi:HAD-IIB family hydrolase [Pseudoteredinibacter isoporae]|uniref:HAD-IIB family hydrolase n=1 Tax=Pseudoteredinibacter isoporae TaxID=570281 RepID=UPI00310BC757
MPSPKPLPIVAPDGASDIKLIFFDVDGTLLDRDGQFSDSLRDQLKRLRGMGMSLAIASGRPPFACQFLFEQLGLIDTGLFYTGGLVFNPVTQRALLQHCLSHSEAQALFEAANELGLYFELYDEQRFVIDPAHQCAPHILEEHSRQLRCEPQREDIGALLLSARSERVDKTTSPWVKVLVGEEAAQSDYLPELERRFPDLHFAYASLPAYPEWRFASVIPKSADKHLAFDQLLIHHQVSANEVMAFGDAGSDKVFLQRSGLGVAMGSAPDDVQACADYHCPSSDDDGVARALACFFPE